MKPLRPALHHLPLRVAEVSLMARGLPFIPPLPFHFLITSPLPSLAGAQTRLSLRYSTFRSFPHFLAVLRRDPVATGNGYL